MKHAGPAALATLEPLLAALRQREALVEKRPGIYYRKGGAFLHFHEDATGLYADVKGDGSKFVRLRVVTSAERAALLRQVDLALSSH